MKNEQLPMNFFFAVDNLIASSSSYELFVASIMQEDVYIGYTALALTLGLQGALCKKMYI